jgi:ribosomal protein S18 acetylase RimI-like enzyme
MSKISIHIAQSKEFPEAALLISRAMINNPIVAAVFQGKQQLMEAITRIAFERLPGQVYLAQDKGQIVGVMRVVEWPNCFPASMEGLELLPSMSMASKGSLTRLKEWQQVWAQHDPKEHHWHIASLAVLPERQRQGIGKQLAKHFCDFVDSKSSAGYLETDKKENVSYYEGFGFKVIGETPIFNEPNWFMWRPKRQG